MIRNSEPKLFTNGNHKYYIGNDGNATIKKWSGKDMVLALPRALGGHLLTAIGSDSFRDCRSLTHITILDSVETIDDYAFEGYDNVTLIVSPGSPATEYTRRCDLKISYI